MARWFDLIAIGGVLGGVVTAFVVLNRGLAAAAAAAGVLVVAGFSMKAARAASRCRIERPGWWRRFLFGVPREPFEAIGDLWMQATTILPPSPPPKIRHLRLQPEKPTDVLEDDSWYGELCDRVATYVGRRFGGQGADEAMIDGRSRSVSSPVGARRDDPPRPPAPPPRRYAPPATVSRLRARLAELHQHNTDAEKSGIIEVESPPRAPLFRFALLILAAYSVLIALIATSAIVIDGNAGYASVVAVALGGVGVLLAAAVFGALVCLDLL